MKEGYKILGWVVVAHNCTRCEDMPAAVILVTDHTTDEGLRASLAAQICLTCVHEDDDLAGWVKEHDPWDEVSEELDVAWDMGPTPTDVCPEYPIIKRVGIEPRCVRCRMMPVDFVGVCESVPEGTIGLGFLHLCRVCKDGFEVVLTRGDPGPT